MRMQALSRESGVPVATIKFYLREGLLPAGRLTHPNQAQYGQAHLDRLRLVRTIVGRARLPLARVRQVVGVLDGASSPLEALGHSPGPGPIGSGLDSQDRVWAAALLEGVVKRRGWRVVRGSAQWEAALEELAAMRVVGLSSVLARVDDYAEAADRFGAVHIATIADHVDRPRQAEVAATGAVLVPLLRDGLVRLAEEHYSMNQWA